VVGVAVQHAGGEITAEGHAGKSVEVLDSVQHGDWLLDEFGLSIVDGRDWLEGVDGGGECDEQTVDVTVSV
jgi:hypothetical protein